MNIIGIDPGLSGAIALLDAHSLPAVWDMPTIEVTVNGKKRRRIDQHAFVRLIIGIGKVDMIVLEEAGTRPGEGSVAAFSYGRGFGQLEGVLCALERPLTLVRPQVWTKALGVGSDKGVHVQAARNLFPEVADVLLKTKDGRSDALLIAQWFRRHG